MATVLDVSILGDLSVIFIFLLLFVGGWGLLRMIDPFKLKNDGYKLYAVFAFAISFLVMLSPLVMELISFAIPWFTVLLTLAFFMLFFASMFSTEYDFKELGSNPTVYGFMIFFVVVILLFAFANSLGQDLLEKQVGDAPTDADLIEREFTPTDTFIPADQVDDYTPKGYEHSAVRSAASSNIADNIILTLFHPKVLGMLFVLVLATVTILLIAR